MDRKAFLASLPFLPSAVKAVLRKPEPAVPRQFTTKWKDGWNNFESVPVEFNPQKYHGEIQWMSIHSNCSGIFHGQA